MATSEDIEKKEIKFYTKEEVDKKLADLAEKMGSVKKQVDDHESRLEDLEEEMW